MCMQEPITSKESGPVRRDSGRGRPAVVAGYAVGAVEAAEVYSPTAGIPTWLEGG